MSVTSVRRSRFTPRLRLLPGLACLPAAALALGACMWDRGTAESQSPETPSGTQVLQVQAEPAATAVPLARVLARQGNTALAQMRKEWSEQIARGSAGAGNAALLAGPVEPPGADPRTLVAAVAKRLGEPEYANVSAAALRS